MEWKTIAQMVGAAAPMLGGLLAGPAGSAIGSVVASALGVGATPDAVLEALKSSPDAAVKLREIEASQSVQLQSLLVRSEENRLAAETAAALAVNATMQAEAGADHWPTYSWRPFCGFVFGTMFLGVYFVLPLAKVPVPVIPTEAWLAIGGVLGAASYFRGKAQADPRVTTDNRG
jgi:hypothetical protein